MVETSNHSPRKRPSRYAQLVGTSVATLDDARRERLTSHRRRDRC